ncbi:hypothetical protein TNCV_3546011 [Trichonephila clavipes]|nr:hypothetical protein TNCV_3546011 [Trichonephila clavipes]
MLFKPERNKPMCMEKMFRTIRKCQNWFAKFRSGSFDVEDAPHSGKLVEAAKDTIKALFDVNHRITLHVRSVRG